MNALSQRSATLLDASPSLSRTLGVRTALRVGNQPILPTITVPAGAWTAPAAATLGPGTFALAVIDGLLLSVGSARLVHGPGDHLVPWSGDAVWTACTPLRLAVLGQAFTEALRPHATARRGLHHSPQPLGAPFAGTLDERLMALLWRVARRWGTLEAGAIALPREVDRPTLAVLCDAPEDDVTGALARLAGSGTLRARRDGGWLLPLPGGDTTRARRDELNARIAEQFAVSRMASATYVSIARSLTAEQDRRSPSSR